MAKWYAVTGGEVERLEGAWIDAPTSNLETLGMLLGVARDAVWSFAPESEDDNGFLVDVPGPDDDDVPDRLVYAQLQHAKALWDAGRVSTSGDVGLDQFTYTPRPLDKTIRAIIRPMKGRFSVG